MTNREIDKEIAEKVFNTPRETAQPYSTSIEDAWLVVEKMRTIPKIDMDIFIAPIYVGVKIVTYDKNGYMTKFYEQDKSAPMAICKAALKAYESM